MRLRKSVQIIQSIRRGRHEGFPFIFSRNGIFFREE